MSATVLSMSMSLDRFIAGPKREAGATAGDGGHRLQGWPALLAWTKRAGYSTDPRRGPEPTWGRRRPRSKPQSVQVTTDTFETRPGYAQAAVSKEPGKGGLDLAPGLRPKPRSSSSTRTTPETEAGEPGPTGFYVVVYG